MSRVYKQNFSLKDILNNKKLKNVLPLVNYKETEREDGFISRTTKMKTVQRIINDSSVSAARVHYKPFKGRKSGPVITLSGTLRENASLRQVQFAVRDRLRADKHLIELTGTYGDVLRDALKESEKKGDGVNDKLFLRVGSMKEIESMNKPQLKALMHNMLENVMYSDNFEKTQKKWNLEGTSVLGKDYERNKMNFWRRPGMPGENI